MAEGWYWIIVSDRSTGKILEEYASVFTDGHEALLDVEMMIEEGRLPYADEGYTIDIFDAHPDVPGARPVMRRGVRPT